VKLLTPNFDPEDIKLLEIEGLFDSAAGVSDGDMEIERDVLRHEVIEGDDEGVLSELEVIELLFDERKLLEALGVAVRVSGELREKVGNGEDDKDGGKVEDGVALGEGEIELKKLGVKVDVPLFSEEIECALDLVPNATVAVREEDADKIGVVEVVGEALKKLAALLGERDGEDVTEGMGDGVEDDEPSNNRLADTAEVDVGAIPVPEGDTVKKNERVGTKRVEDTVEVAESVGPKGDREGLGENDDSAESLLECVRVEVWHKEEDVVREGLGLPVAEEDIEAV